MGLFDVGENNVGQFGADNTNIIRYKQAAEYAEDARLYAIQAAEAVVDADNLLNRAEEILQEARDIIESVKDIEADVNALETRVTAAEAVANDAIAKAQKAIEDTAGIIARAEGYAFSAETSANAAQGFSQSAQQYATVANTAATQAQGFRDEADGFADEAETHVAEAESAVTNASTQADRAKSEADRAAEIVAGIPGKETIDGFAKLYKSRADADADLNDRTVGDKVLVWDEGDSVYTWYDITGTLDNKELTLNSTEKRLKSVNNIQPDIDGNVQITLPSGNPSLWLGETVFFQYDPDKGVSYPGLLPQNGNEYNRADYPDLWATIEQDLIPSVTEAEWQAGRTNCFSTGDGTTTFRVPKWEGEAIRTPNSNDQKGSLSVQVPYVVSVNGVLPNDSTGNVAIDLSSYAKTADTTLAINNATSNKANKGANTDITSLAGLTTALSISQGGTGGKNASDARTGLGLKGASILDVGTTSGTVASGNDSRFDTLQGKTGGVVTSGVIVNGGLSTQKTVTSEVSQSSEAIGTAIFTGTTERARASVDIGVSAGGDRVGRFTVSQDATPKVWTFVYSNGNATAPGQWVNGSDKRFKTNIQTIENPLDKMTALRGCTWERLDMDATGIGFIAQDVQKIFPNSVYINNTPTTLRDGTVLNETLSVDTSGVSAALHHEAILALMDEIENLKQRIDTLEQIAAQ